MLGIRTILHPTDFSSLARRAFEVACSLAQDYKAQLVLLHVHEPPVPMGELVPTEPPDVRDYLIRELSSLETPPDVMVDRQLEIGAVVEGILFVAGERKCDLIVIGTHGRGGLGRVLLGSVAESVLRKAPCMVLTVKGEASG
jgi:nucleotide-binding universal stress UspA family protein